MVRNKKKIFRGMLAVLILIALLFSFPQVAQGVTQGVGNVLKWPAETVTKVSDMVVRVAKASLLLIGAYVLVSLGVASALPVIAIGFVVAGLAVAAYALWDWFNPKGAKPDNVNLGGLN
jgi:phage shock protein PspC (stress-responsive transcriptional regulator)